MKTYQMQFGDKIVAGKECEPGIVTIRCPCEFFPFANVWFKVSTAQADELFSDDRRCIQNIIPEINYQLREIIQTGISPAEFDRDIRGIAPDMTMKRYAGGYEYLCRGCEKIQHELVDRGSCFVCPECGVPQPL